MLLSRKDRTNEKKKIIGESMKRMLITGADGVLGRAITQHFSSKVTLLGTNRSNMDVVNNALVQATINEFRPDIVIHLAAITNLELCQKNPILAERVNVYGTQNVLRACQKSNCKMIYASTGAVFDGTKKDPYNENDSPNPISVYGKTKYKCEKLLEACPGSLIVRFGWIFGGFERDQKFVNKIIKQLQKGTKRLKVVTDLRGSPTFSEDVATCFERLLDKTGIYHVANPGYATRYEMVKVITSIYDKNIELEPVSGDFFKATYTAPRPVNETLDTTKLSYLCELRAWQRALEEYVIRIRSKVLV